MVNYRLIFGLFLAMVLAFSPAWAQGMREQAGEAERGIQREMEQQRQTGQQMMDQQRQTGQQAQELGQAAPLPVSEELIGKQVQNRQGEDLGEVHDVVLGPDGQVGYIILSRGGVLGMGENLYPIPKDAVSFDQQNDIVMVDIDQQRLEQAPTIASDDLSGLSNPDYAQRVHSYYGVEAKPGMEGEYKSMRGQQPGTQRQQPGTQGRQ